MPRRSTKPAFEVPAETAVQRAPVGWVYREEVTAERCDNPLVTVGVGLFLVGAGTIAALSLATLGLAMAPWRVAKAISDRL